MTIEPIAGGSITSVPGFRASGVACGLKKNGALDLALVLSDWPCVGAAMFTTNAFQAAPVLYDRQTVAANPESLRAVVINSGCANACTGEPGLEDTRATAALAARELGVAPNAVLVMSTGVIGARLPMDKIAQGVRQAAAELSATEVAGHAASRAIMTTDTVPKTLAVRVNTQGASWTIAGMAKGAGMIHPNMATMLCAVVTDASLTPVTARSALQEAVDASLNRVTVDGDTSTNDTILLLANGQAGGAPIDSVDSAAYRAFVQGLTHLTIALAKALARDGEGATKFVEITVQGARSERDAHIVGQAVARSLLVKTALYGQDANWGRIVCAVGYSGVSVDPQCVSVWLGELELFRRGAPYDVDEARAAAILARDEVGIRIDLGQGTEQATVWTCDLSHGYVDINAHYRT
jgi:glutamate N-acetyltransferase/amino-acid N-acetyltransferase